MTKIALALSPKAYRDARTFLGLSQDELASAAEISVSTLRRCERGDNVSDYARKQITAALEAQGAVFVGGRLAD
jgi:DNA-binding transcriptional regulator YiaG